MSELNADTRGPDPWEFSVPPPAPTRAAPAEGPAGGGPGAGSVAEPADGGAAHVGPYKLLARLGEGGMGVVYTAEQRHPRRTVALKVVRPLLVSPALLKRFEYEGEVLGRLQHPGIAHIYEAGTADTDFGPQPYFAMEWVVGRPLTEYATATRLTVPERLDLLARVCDAVQYAHQRGVIHRDLKPGNILVTADGQPKVLDFGLARATGPDVQGLTTEADAGQILGTLAYMSPEQASGDPGEVDTRSDVYALGVIAYELLAGRTPHRVDGRSLAEAVRVIREEDPVPLRSLDRAWRGDVDTIVAKAMEKDKSRRYAGASALAADLRRHLRDEPIAARSASASYQLGKLARRHRAAVAGAAAVVLVLVLGVVVASWQAVRATKARRRSDDLRQLASTFLLNLQDPLESLRGPAGDHDHLLRTMLEALDKLAAEAEGDPSLQRDVAAALVKVGDVQGNPEFYNLRNRAGALDSYRKALRIRGRLAAADPGNARARRDWSIALEKVGDMEAATGHHALALASYQGVVDARKPLAEADPEDTRARLELSAAYGKLGDVRLAVGDPAGALADYRTAGSIAGPMGEAYALYPDIQRHHARVFRRSADASLAMGDRAAAAGLYREAMEQMQAWSQPDDAWGTQARLALEIAQGLLKVEPGDVTARQELAENHWRVGELDRAMGNLTDALPSYLRSLEVWRGLADEYPDNAVAKHRLRVGHFNIAWVYAGQGARRNESVPRRIVHWQRARAHFRDCARVVDRLSEAGQIDPAHARGVYESLTNRVKMCDDRIAELRRPPGPGPATSRALGPARAHE